MEFNDFVLKVEPKAKRFLMESLKEQILELVALDYAYWQINSWLSMKGIDVSLDALKEFIDTKKSEKRRLLEIDGPDAANSNKYEPYYTTFKE